MSKRPFNFENQGSSGSESLKRSKIYNEGRATRAECSPKKKLACSDYTVGWICAIGTEYVAAQAFLDEEHEGPEYVASNDNNDYTLGRVGKHNVAIAVLPDGEYGTSSAASVAKDMLHSFPNIKVGLMVGIGGGAPSPKHDIRLGDIVVSTVGDGRGGVLHYNFGKSIQGRGFQITGFLNQPPTFLRTAVSGLKSQYELKGHRIEESINATLERIPRLLKKYKRPEWDSDKLFKPDLVHDSSCMTTCSTNPSHLIIRHRRTKEDDNPTIHYGLIASADQLTEDALLRDRFAAEHGVLCFEMEAAGLMNHFPCLVIRGICDYSDSHKNKTWQGYAAMVAAAYTKDLLYRIPPSKIEAETRIGDILSNVQDGIDRLIRLQTSEEYDPLLNWFTKLDYSIQQSDHLRTRQPGTGQWLLDSNQYREWLGGKGKTLLCPGIPGSGKTILTSIVVDDLCNRFSNSPTGIAYLYFKFNRKDEQTVESLFSSLLQQLIRKWIYLQTVPDSIRALYNRHNVAGTRPLHAEIITALHCVAALYTELFVVIDALDECQNSIRSRFLSELFVLQEKTRANIFITSRFTPDILERWQEKIHLTLEVRARVEDIRMFLDSNISRLPGFVVRDKQLREEVTTHIAQSVDGMFLLAQLHLDALAGQSTPKSIRTSLAKLLTQRGSTAYDESYKNAMLRIGGQSTGQRELAKQVLSWIICAKRPLATIELQHALAIENGETQLDSDNITQIEDIIAVCAGLVSADEEGRTIWLVHYTAQEYFVRTQRSWFPNAESDITEACITYLSFDTFKSGFLLAEDEFHDRLLVNPFYTYAASNWGRHARAAHTENIQNVTLGFLGNPANVSSSCQAMMFDFREFKNSQNSQKVPRLFKPLHLAAFFGLEGVAKIIIQDETDLEPEDTYGRTPLTWAAINGHGEFVTKLLHSGRVNLNAKDRMGRTALSYAAGNGHAPIVHLFLGVQSVDINSKDYWDLSSFDAEHAASKRGLKVSADYTSTRRRVVNNRLMLGGRTPLSWAARNGHCKVVELLLESEGADASAKDAKGRTPLFWAAMNGHEAVVRLLLAKDEVDPDLRETSSMFATKVVPTEFKGYKRRPLLWAASNGYEEVARLLLATGRVNVNATNAGDMSPLSCAAEKGHTAVVSLLLSHDGVDLEARDPLHGRTPLWTAASLGHEKTVKLLLDKGANIESIPKCLPSRNGQTPLSVAAAMGHEAVVKLLVENSAALEPRDTLGQTPLLLAARNGHSSIVQLLLDSGLDDADSRDNQGRTSLSWASGNWHDVNVQLLLATGRVDADSKDSQGRTPLFWACFHELDMWLTEPNTHQNEKHLSVKAEAFQMFLTTGNISADCLMENNKDQVEEYLSAGEKIVQLLLATGNVSVDCSDDEGHTPLSCASEREHGVIIEQLLAGGASLGAKETGRGMLARCEFPRTEKVVKSGILWTSVPSLDERFWECDIHLPSKRLDDKKAHRPEWELYEVDESESESEIDEDESMVQIEWLADKMRLMNGRWVHP